MVIAVLMVVIIIVPVLIRILETPVKAVWQPGAIHEDRLALVHRLGDVRLAMAVECDDRSVLLFLCLLPLQAVLSVCEVE